MQYLYHVLSLREPVFIRPAELGGIQQVFFIKDLRYKNCIKVWFGQKLVAILFHVLQKCTFKIPHLKNWKENYHSSFYMNYLELKRFPLYRIVSLVCLYGTHIAA